MWHFFDKLCTVALPRIRDFQGLTPKAFDGRGNYSIGLKEQLVFTEIDYDTFDKIRGMDVTIVTTARTDAEGAALLKGLGMPLREK
jgi:large subunit ribosomal protein L5